MSLPSRTVLTAAIATLAAGAAVPQIMDRVVKPTNAAQQDRAVMMIEGGAAAACLVGGFALGNRPNTIGRGLVYAGGILAAVAIATAAVTGARS